MRIESIEKLRSWLKSPASAVTDHTHTHVNILVAEASRVQSALNAAMGETFTVHMDGQDRTDFAQIEIPAALLLTPQQWRIELRLSSTWPLVAVSNESVVDPSALEQIKQTLENIGCIPVSQKIFENGSEQEKLDDLWGSLFDFW